MNFKTKPTEGKCWTARCRKKAEVRLGVGGEHFADLCQPHYKEAAAEVMANVADIEVKGDPIEPDTAPAGVDTQELAAARTTAETDLAAVQGFEIASDEDLAFAEEERASIKGQWKAFEKKRTAATKPMNAALREINGWFKPVQGALKAIEAAWSGKIIEAAKAKEAERQRLLAEAQAHAEAGDTSAVRSALVQASEAELQTSQVSIRKTWTFDIENETVLPREYLCPDRSAIAIAVREGVRDIPGVRIYERETVYGPSRS